MRMTQSFGQTLRETPAQADAISHQLLWRAGYLLPHTLRGPSADGGISLLPLGMQVLQNLQTLLIDALQNIGAQEIRTSLSHPEVMLSDLVQREIQSYKQLPVSLFHFQSKQRLDPHSRLGLLQTSPYQILEVFSLISDETELENSFQAQFQFLQQAFIKCNLSIKVISADFETVDNPQTFEFVYLSPIGEDNFLQCDHCGYSSSQATARIKKLAFPNESPLPCCALFELEKVPTPGASTIADVSAYLHIPESKTAKAVFFIEECTALAEISKTPSSLLVFAVLRGDMNLSEIKLQHAISELYQDDHIQLRLAKDEEILSVGAVPGFASPLSIDRSKVLLIVDDLIPDCPNLVAGANEIGFHLKNVNYSRDFTADLVCDIAAAEEGSSCPICASTLKLNHAFKLAQFKKFSANDSHKLDCTYLDEQGEAQPILMSSSSLDLERLMACVVEEHHDEKGMRLPISLAPYPIHLVLIPSKDSKVQGMAEVVYDQLTANGLMPLYDDREERAGVKFNDADLIGLPIRLTISERTLAKDCVEFKRRDQEEKREIPLSDLIPFLQSEMQVLKTAPFAVHSSSNQTAS